ncbi:MAG: SufS family cysteine desulfurase [Atopobiaceae bacterium]|nr:SufS family cysteine desulfurase [Atopobiaceae bacterium]
MSEPRVLPQLSLADNPYKVDYPLLVANPELAFLDSAATAQRPASVLDAQRSFYETMNANPLRGLYSLSVRATEAISDTRAHIARHLGSDNPSEVIFCRNTSEALNLVARSYGVDHIGEGDEVVISIMEHHSNLVPWQELCRERKAQLVYMRPDDQGTMSEAEIDAKIGPATKVVAVTHVSNVLGVENPIAAIAERAHSVGAVVVVDAAQSAPHMALDVRELGCDFLAFSAHKMGGPFGIGVLWGRMDLLSEMRPFLTGGEMIEWVSETEAGWAQVPEKFEAGTQDAAGIYALDAALTHLETIGFDVVEQRERALTARLCERLAAHDHVTIIGPDDPEAHIGAVSFNLGDIHSHDVASILDMEGVAIRAGYHCAQPLLTWMGAGSCCRASVALYNDESDIDRLIDGLDRVWEVFHGHI